MLGELFIYMLLFGAGILAGVCNAIAGGGTFFTFPLFLAAGIPPVVANASNAIAVWPGHALAVIGYQRELQTYAKGLGVSIIVALMGGVIGAILLTQIDNRVFLMWIPFLILFATILFALGEKLNRAFLSLANNRDFSNPGILTRFCELTFAIYGGFFGAGLGIMMMAGLTMLGVRDIQANNALKNLLASVVTSIAVLIFALSGVVAWSYTLIAFSGALIGGLLGVRIARKLPKSWLRVVIITVGFSLSLYYFWKLYI